VTDRCIHGYHFDIYCPTCSKATSVLDNPDTRFAKEVARALKSRLLLSSFRTTCRDIAGRALSAGAADTIVETFRNAGCLHVDRASRLEKMHLDALCEWIAHKDMTWCIAKSCRVCVNIDRSLLNNAQEEDYAPWSKYLVKLSEPMGWVQSVLCESLDPECYVLGAWSVTGEWFDESVCDNDDLRFAYLVARRANWLVARAACARPAEYTGSSTVYLHDAGETRSGSTRILLYDQTEPVRQTLRAGRVVTIARRRAHDRRGFIGRRRCGPGHSEVRETWIRPARIPGTGAVESQMYSLKERA
jgi:hypothetical protein